MPLLRQRIQHIDLFDQPWELFCEQCAEEFCGVCFAAIHASGSRKEHITHDMERLTRGGHVSGVVLPMSLEVASQSEAQEDDDERRSRSPTPMAIASPQDGEMPSAPTPELRMLPVLDGRKLKHRAAFIPLRLTRDEREVLALMEAALEISEYTDKVDVLTYRSKIPIMTQQLDEFLDTVAGLVVTTDLNKGKKLVKGDHGKNAGLYATMFEVVRRQKVLNPDKLRTSYGKLMYMLMDSEAIREDMGIHEPLVAPIQTVYSMLSDRGPRALALLDDPYLPTATAEVSLLGRSRAELDDDLNAKRAARSYLIREYSGSSDDELTADEVERVILSISDANAFLDHARGCVEAITELLNEHFSPEEDDAWSLAIRAGVGGARLSHSHATQFEYVSQTFELWGAIQYNFYELAMACDADLIGGGGAAQKGGGSFYGLGGRNYRLRDTGQGLQRMMSAPKGAGTLSRILGSVQAKFGRWIGSSAIHSGDVNVPNALVIIDKYVQVPRILWPVVNCVRAIPSMSPCMLDIVGGSERAIKFVLRNFFCYGFDGSGANNWSSAGSCIDGRLTSTWNWCSHIEKKSFFPLFLLAGFVGFDGKF
ncbi:uncharacterized protein AMSG_06283 [Thecamonas trahens ATCC 50062]|uniref:Non-canonical E2 ubiquitin-conjugating enzyme C-terminal domain-containing protein n=1 Tax=Thecamonas trahens ATCC 50062 TaxID=461836 RepID=A0A0L0DFR0_THETB|nr:hypothetical protein AMSG_06283 [Thecamonas trahens ATCC 50062]KNC50148.1 hypothetical protein AMSG_06283 [Thecamonas trahens ATCC 50062]|eukprot:XP_013756994.1 hypothetical protein AMSG_06283 [Thecamonas trahens ATCC 50062]